MSRPAVHPVTRPGPAVGRSAVLVWITLLVSACASPSPAGITSEPMPSTASPVVEVPDQRDSADAVVHGEWTTLPIAPTGPVRGAILAWDGTELLQVGGAGSGPMTQAAAFNPVTRQWRALAASPVPMTSDYLQDSSDHATAVWTGQALFVLTTRGAALLDPTANTWTAIPSPPLTQVDHADAVWTGRQVVVTAQTTQGIARTEVAAFTPATRTWTRIGIPGIADHDQLATAVAAVHDQVILWSLWGHSYQVNANEWTVTSWIDVYRLGPDQHWRNVTGSWPQHQGVDDPLFTGTSLIVPAGQIWCGACTHPPPTNSQGYLVDPTTLAVTDLPHGRLDDYGGHQLWTGRAVLAINVGSSGNVGGTTVRPGTMAVWDPATTRWALTTAAPAALDDHTTAVWGHHQLFALDASGHLTSFGAADLSHPGTASP